MQRALDFNKIVRQVWQTTIKAINNHGEKSARMHCRSSILRKTTDVHANTVVEKVFGTNFCRGS